MEDYNEEEDENCIINNKFNNINTKESNSTFLTGVDINNN